MELPDNLRIAYEATEYWVDDAPSGPFYLRCGERSPKLDDLLAGAGLGGWVYITASNPGSCQLSDEENMGRMQRLEVQLRALNCVIYHGRGGGTAGNWPAEPSFLALGLGEEEGLEIGRTFGQNAIVVGTRGEPAQLVTCR